MLTGGAGFRTEVKQVREREREGERERIIQTQHSRRIKTADELRSTRRGNIWKRTSSSVSLNLTNFEDVNETPASSQLDRTDLDFTCLHSDTMKLNIHLALPSIWVVLSRWTGPVGRRHVRPVYPGGPDTPQPHQELEQQGRGAQQELWGYAAERLSGGRRSPWGPGEVQVLGWWRWSSEECGPRRTEGLQSWRETETIWRCTKRHGQQETSSGEEMEIRFWRVSWTSNLKFLFFKEF